MAHIHYKYNKQHWETWTPVSFADAYYYIVHGCEVSVALKETLDKFYTSSREVQKAMLSEPIPQSEIHANKNIAAYIAAIVEQLAVDYRFLKKTDIGTFWTANPSFCADVPYTTFDISLLEPEKRDVFKKDCLELPKNKNVYITYDSFSYRGLYPPRDWGIQKFMKYNNTIL